MVHEYRTGHWDGLYRACAVHSGIVPHSPMMYHGTRVQDGTLGSARACVVHSGICTTESHDVPWYMSTGRDTGIG